MGLLSDGHREGNLDAGIGSINILVQMGLNNAIVIEADPLTEGVLGNFEPTIDITPER